MLEKSDNAAEPAPTVPELDESIFSLDPEGGITTRMRRRLLLRRFWQSAARSTFTPPDPLGSVNP